MSTLILARLVLEERIAFILKNPDKAADLMSSLLSTSERATLFRSMARAKGTFTKGCRRDRAAELFEHLRERHSVAELTQSKRRKLESSEQGKWMTRHELSVRFGPDAERFATSLKCREHPQVRGVWQWYVQDESHTSTVEQHENMTLRSSNSLGIADAEAAQSWMRKGALKLPEMDRLEAPPVRKALAAPKAKATAAAKDFKPKESCSKSKELLASSRCFEAARKLTTGVRDDTPIGLAMLEELSSMQQMVIASQPLKLIQEKKLNIARLAKCYAKTK